MNTQKIIDNIDAGIAVGLAKSKRGASMKIIHSRRSADDKDLEVQLFEVLNGEEKPFRIRLVDKKTGEVGPQILMYDSLSGAAKHYEKHTPTW